MTDTPKSPDQLSEAKRKLFELLLAEERAGEESAARAAAIPAVDRSASLPLSYSQQRMWFLDRLDPDNRAYNIPVGVLLRGRLEVSALEASLNETIRRHEVLRTRFVAEDGRPRQRIRARLELRIPRIDLRALPAPARRAELERLAVEHNLMPYDLEEGPLLRSALVAIADEEQVLLLNMHHIVSDTWSIGLCVEEMAALYEAFATGRPPALAALPCQYVDYAAWQRRQLEDEELERQMAYWREALSGELPALELPTDRPRLPVQAAHGHRLFLRISAQATAALKALVRAQDATLFVLLLTVFDILLYRISGQTDLLVGTTVAGRRRPELERLIGLFINTLVLRADLSSKPTFDGPSSDNGPQAAPSQRSRPTAASEKPTFRALLGRLRESTFGALEHQDIRFEKLVDELQPTRDLSRNALFQVQFSVQSAPMQAMRHLGLEMIPIDVDSGTARFDLELILWDWADGLKGYVEYNSQLFDRTTIERLANGFQALVDQVLDDPDTPISDLLPITGSAAQQLLVEWNDTAAPALCGSSILPRIESWADSSPEAPAVLAAGARLSYRQLNERANQLAHHLRQRGVGPEAVVGVCLRRSPELVVALLGTLKAGGAYLPLDPDAPQERLRRILEDARAAVVLAQQETAASLPETGVGTVLLDRDRGIIARHPGGNPAIPLSAAVPAYVIYTSGSTGTPKGVVSCHGGLVNRLRWMQRALSLNTGDAVLQKTSFTFDVSVWEFFWPLIAGAALVVARPGGQGDPAYLAELIDEYRVTTCHFVPSMLRIFLDDPRVGACRSLRRVIVSGEALPKELERRFLARFSADLYNLYGPTEASIDVTWRRCDRRDPHLSVPIGRPIANTAILVLDRRGRAVPLGVPGELHIGGVGLARGYLHQPALTASAFVPDPRSADPGGRLYQTGDLVRTLPDGEIEFLGRLDTQVKVRGFRIELGEIEAVLSQHPAVDQVVAMSRRDGGGDGRLVAYLATREGEAPNVSELRGFLAARLPEYSVPAAFVVLDALPLTASGKVDRRALPAPDHQRPEQDAAYAAPRSATERAIAEIWKEVLGIDRVGLRDNFFDLGGDSLLLAQMHSRLRAAVDAEIAMIDLFRYTTIRALTDHVRRDAGEEPEARAEPRRTAAPGQESDDVAIISMALRFPGADTPEAFWRNLAAGVESVSFFSEEECLASGVDPDALADPNYVRAEAVLEDVDRFAARFFDVSPREAELTDPQQRIFLEVAWEALERAGYCAETCEGEIGVFGGVSMSTYLLNNLTQFNAVNVMANFQTRVLILTSNEKDFLSQKLSYLLKLKGPSVNVQTACSSALVAVHLACQSLLRGECRMALAGGVQIRVPQKVGYLYLEGGLPSPDGHCRPFDAQAMGTVHGNGAGIVVLKRLADAVADGDPIHAVIKGSAVNNDADLKVGFTAPSLDGLTRVATAALATSGVDPATIGFVEAHGTGTELGDTLEAAALTSAFRRSTDQTQYCYLGGVKSNIGHLDAASAIAGLLKAVLALENRQIPPTLHFAEPNPKIGFESTPFRVNAELVDWPAAGDGTPRRAGVNVFGIGGTNAHVILEEAPAPEPSGESRPWQLVVLSARTTTALHRATENLSDTLRRHPEAELADIAYTLQVGRKGFPIRRAVVCRDADDALDALRTLDPRRVWSGAGDDARPVAFLFPGEGVDPAPLAAELHGLESVFREELERCLELAGDAGETLRQVLCPPVAAELDWDRPSAATRAGLFAVEYALARLWMSWGVRPQTLVGDGVGELVAACLAGVLSLPDALAPGAIDADSLSPPRIPLLSSVTGAWLTPREATDPDTWSRRRHAAPRIDEALGQLFGEAESVFLEVGPGEVWSGRVEEHADYGFEQPMVRSSPPDSESVPAALAAALANLWTAGVEVDWQGYSRGQRRRRLILPTYPFERERYWIEGEPPGKKKEKKEEKKTAAAVADWFYAPTWKRAPDPVPAAAPGRWLLVGRDEAITPPLLRHLGEAGDEVIVVEAGERFERRSRSSYSIRPREQEDYSALLAELAADGGVPEKILHGWGFGVAPDGSDDLPAVSLFHLSRALGRLELSEPVTLGVVTSGLQAVTGDEALEVDKATLLGLCKVLPRELEKLHCCAIDLLPNEAVAVERLAAELSGDADERVAYRGPRRWVHGWEPFRPPLPEAADERVRRRGVYLFLHALEGPGAALAETLVRDYQARLVAVEPPGFPAAEDWDGWLEAHADDDASSRKIRRFRSLEEAGAELLVAAADPGQRRRLAAIRDAALERFGALDGVVTCVDPAAWSRDVLDTELEVWENLIRSHARSLVVLEEILDALTPDFCLVVSEPATALGVAGAAVGAAIGSFIDLFVERHNQTSPVPWVHLSVDARDLPRDQGRELWRRLLATRGLSQILIAPGGPTRAVQPPPEAPGPTRHRRPDLKQEYVAPRNSLEEIVAGIWEEVLGIETIGIRDDLLELGGNSLLATQLVSRVRDLFGVELSLQEMNELRTVAELTAALERHGIDQAAADEVVELMNALEGMSDEEAERLTGDEIELV